MTQDEFIALIDGRIEVAKRCGLPHSLEFYQLIMDHIAALESLKTDSVAPYEDIVIPPFPAI